MENEKIILGIDPGTLIMGYGVVKQKGKEISFVGMDVLNMKKIPDATLKLEAILSEIYRLIDFYQPHCMAIESPFYGKNVQSLIKLGRAQGVAIAAAMSKGIPVFEYAPLRIKQSITGKGRASKEQVDAMLHHIMKIDTIPKYLDASDALSVAVCHVLQNPFHLRIIEDKSKKEKLGTSTKKIKSGNTWEKFLKENPGRGL